MASLCALLPRDETLSKEMPSIVPSSNERTIAAVFLIIIIAMQIVSALTRAIQNSDGRCGRLLYHLAFVINVMHELFIGIVVPASLAWTAYELFAGVRTLDAILAAIVGCLWYGPERVQHSIANLYSVCKRRSILIAALGKYHRVARYKGIDEVPLTNALPITRRLRFWPWWSSMERKAKEYWNGRVREDGGHFVVLADVQLRSIAREGVTMALTGDFDESKLRYWCTGMVADQARFPLSKLKDVSCHAFPSHVLDGHEGKYLNQSLNEHKGDWTQDEIQRLATVVDGIRKKGLVYVLKEEWLG